MFWPGCPKPRIYLLKRQRSFLKELTLRRESVSRPGMVEDHRLGR